MKMEPIPYKINRILKIFDALDTIDRVDELSSDDNCLDLTIKHFTENQLISYDETDCKTDDIEDLKNKSTIRTLKDTNNPLERLSNNEFELLYRFSKETVQDILQMINYGLTKHTNRGHPFSPMIQLLITLRFLATGSFQSKTDNQVSQPTISRIIKKVTTLLSEQKLRFIKIPDKNDFKRVSNKFFAQGKFPDIFGCIGSTHVAIKCPGKAMADGYLNERGFYSFRILIVCGPDLEFYEIISRWPGATIENKIFNISEIHQRFEYNQLDGVLLADKHYANRNFVLTPVDSTRNIKEWRYNEAHRLTYNVPEVVDIWKRRFKCLQTVLNNKEETTQSIIAACAVLHNLAIQRNQPFMDTSEQSHSKDSKLREICAKRKYPMEMNVMQEPLGLLEREHFIQKHF